MRKLMISSVVINGENASYTSRKFSGLRNRTRKTFLDELTKTYVKNGNFGSTSTLSALASQILGTQDNLNRSGDRTHTSTSNFLSRRLSLSALPSPTKKSDDASTDRNAESFSIQVVSQHRASVPSRPPSSNVPVGSLVSPVSAILETTPSTPVLSGKTTAGPASVGTPTAPVVLKSVEPPVRAATIATPVPVPRVSSAADTEKAWNAIKNLEREKLIEQQRAASLKTENADLKLKLDRLAIKEVNRLLFEQNELKLKIELKETRLKLAKAMAYIESLPSDVQGMPTELKSKPGVQQ
jgi:hypothetical protein